MNKIKLSILLTAIIMTFNSNAQETQLAVDWIIHTLRGEKVTGEERPYITIDYSLSRFYGNNGCNVLNGDVKVSDTDAIAFTNVLSTQRMCQDAPYEYMINTTLDDVVYYKIDKKGNESYLDLMNSRRKVVMTLRKHNMDFLNGAWRVTAINTSPNSNEEIRMLIDIPETRIHGNTGCNIFNGNLYIDPDKNNSIQFFNIGSTRMRCDNQAIETALLVALEVTESGHLLSDDTVKLCDSEGREVLRLQRIPIDQLRAQ